MRPRVGAPLRLADERSVRVDPVAQPAEEHSELGLLLGLEHSREDGDDVALVAGESHASALSSEVREDGEGAAPVVRAGPPLDEAGLDETVDGPRQPTRRQARLGGEVGHPQPASFGASEAQQDLEGLSTGTDLAGDTRGQRVAKPGRRLEHETDEGDRVDPATPRLRRHGYFHPYSIALADR